MISPTLYLEPRGAAGRAVVQVLTVYTAPTGGGMLQDCVELEGSDLFGASYRRTSRDNGRSWSAPTLLYQPQVLPGGRLQRQGESALFLSEASGGLYRFYNFHRAVGHPFRGSAWWETELCIEHSVDGGKSFQPAGALPGPEGRPAECCPEVISFCRPVGLPGEGLLLPVQRARPVPGDEDGTLEWEAGCLLGREEGGRVSWQRGGFVRLALGCSPRGIFEPAIAPLHDGRLMMVCRGSNGRNPAIASHKWVAASEDGGASWTPPRPLCFEDAVPFYSASSGSALLRHSSGRLYWFGNLTAENACSNRPRFPLVYAEVDEATLSLRAATVRIIDTRREGDSPNLQLSNFRVYEDRVSGELVLFLARLEARAAGDLGSPSYEYRFYPGAGVARR